MQTNTKANKTHTCTDCNSLISEGDSYYRLSFPIMHGCSPEKSPDEVICIACINKANARRAARKAIN